MMLLAVVAATGAFAALQAAQQAVQPNPGTSHLFFNPDDWSAILLRIALAVLAGGIVGLNRDRIKRPAGLRIYMTVSSEGQHPGQGAYLRRGTVAHRQPWFGGREWALANHAGGYRHRPADY